MASQEPASRPALSSVPRVEDLPRTPDGGFDESAVRDAFDTFRRSMLQLQAQLRVVQAAGQTGPAEPIGHSIRMDALRLIRAAAEFADVLERDAQTASADQYGRVEEEVRKKHRELQEHEAALEVRRTDTERQVLDMLNAARVEARDLRATAEREVDAMTRDAESRGARLLEQSRHQATELTNAARADVAQTLDWARAQASTIIARAQQGAEQLLGAAGLGREEVDRITQAIVDAAKASGGSAPPTAPAVPPRPNGEGSFARLDPRAPSPPRPAQERPVQPPAPPQQAPPPPPPAQQAPQPPVQPPPAPVPPVQTPPPPPQQPASAPPVTPPPAPAPPAPQAEPEQRPEEPPRQPPSTGSFGVPFGTSERGPEVKPPPPLAEPDSE
jgi:cell division septum initiation protein DivIVA